jgi:Gpi18-like mannosyltransferase
MDKIVKNRILLALLFLLYIIILPRQYFVYDFEFWTDWALYIHRHGLTQIYHNPTVNYHPLLLYVLYVYDLIMGTEELIIRNINYIKLFPMLFDFLPIVVLCSFRQKMVEEKIPFLFLLLNISYLFNSMIWGQFDSVHTALCFLALLCAFDRPYWSIGLFMLAIVMKLQAIVFTPVLGIVLLYSIRDFKKLIKVAFAGLAVLTILISPFIIAGELGRLWHVVTHAVGFYPRVAIGAFNFWQLLIYDTYNTMDYTKFMGVTYKQIGLALFLISSGLTLFPLLFRVIKHRKANEAFSKDTKQMLMLAAGMVSLYFFYFNTQMHERYVHPVMLFFFFYAVYSKNYKLYILASIPYFLSLDKCFPDFLPVKHYKIIWAMQVIAIWYALTVIYGTYLYFKQYKPIVEYKSMKLHT